MASETVLADLVPPAVIDPAPPVETPADPPKRRLQPLLRSQCREADFANRRFMVRPTPDMPAEDILNPAFWSTNARGFTIGDRIEVVAQDGSYDLDLRVIDVDPSAAQVKVLRALPETETLHPGVQGKPIERNNDAFVEWGDPTDKWRIVRKRDRAILARGFATEMDARDALRRRFI